MVGWFVQVEFVAEDEIVEIVPNIRMEALNMICVRACPPPTKFLLITVLLVH